MASPASASPSAAPSAPAATPTTRPPTSLRLSASEIARFDALSAKYGLDRTNLLRLWLALDPPLVSAVSVASLTMHAGAPSTAIPVALPVAALAPAPAPAPPAAAKPMPKPKPGLARARRKGGKGGKPRR